MTILCTIQSFILGFIIGCFIGMVLLMWAINVSTDYELKEITKEE